jgi:hypothetical protein
MTLRENQTCTDPQADVSGSSVKKTENRSVKTCKRLACRKQRGFGILAGISVFSCENEGAVDLCKAASPKKGKTVLIDVFSLGLSCDTAPCCKKPKDNLSGGRKA